MEVSGSFVLILLERTVCFFMGSGPNFKGILEDFWLLEGTLLGVTVIFYCRFRLAARNLDFRFRWGMG